MQDRAKFPGCFYTLLVLGLLRVCTSSYLQCSGTSCIVFDCSINNPTLEVPSLSYLIKVLGLILSHIESELSGLL